LGLLIAAGILGISWSKVQWLAAAFTIGLGFGLQEIFANFASGLLLLAERPIRVGDLVTVGEVHGRVMKIQMRATTIRDWKRKELLVPNKDLVTGKVVNWTLSDRVNRIDVPVGIAYGSDTELARKILKEIARDESRILDEPPPRAVFLGFGDSSLNLELRIFVATMDHWPIVITNVHTAIDKRFREAGIEIAFPQRDIHIRSIHAQLPTVRVQTGDQQQESD
jgi:potassium efflux system protein